MNELSLSVQELTELQQTELDSNNTSYDASALTQAKSKWMFGQWQELAGISIQDYVQHPEREKIALLIAAAHQQLDQLEESKKLILLARTWGCDNSLISKVLISGINNSLGKVKALNNDNESAKAYFDNAVTLLLGKSEAKAIRQSRSITEMSNLGLLPQVTELVESEKAQVSLSERPTNVEAKATMLATEIALINHNISLSHQKNQLYQTNDSFTEKESFLERLKRLSPSQLGQDLWVLEKTNYKRGGFFVEFGATDGVMLSNTYLLEKDFGWKGICAEPNPKFFKMLKENRSCTVTNACISDRDDDLVSFILAEEYGGVEPSVKKGKHKSIVASYESNETVIQINTKSLDTVLNECGAPKIIDYISIDTEGHEYQILSTFPFEKWDVKLLTIEHNFEPQRQEIFKLLSSKGYTRIEHKWDDWYFK